MNDIITRIEDLPCSTNAVTVMDVNGDYNIYINAKLSKIEQRKAYQHELEHICRNHFYDHKSASVCEDEVEFLCK